MSASGACPSCGESNPPRARFCIECGARMTEEDLPASPAPASTGERRVVSVLFADLSGFTSFSERSDPEEVRALADEAAGRLGEIVLRYGGTVDKIIGDAVMAVFGAPTTREDDAARAVRAALDMQAYVNEHAARFAGLPLRIGVNTGEAIYAPVGEDHRYSVFGDTVNTAARLQSAAGRGETYVGEPTRLAAGEAIEFDAVPPVAAKGKEEPVPAFKAVAVRGARRRRPARAAPLTGRRAEMDRLWEQWERVRSSRTPQLISVLGPPGIGKSRLLGEVVERIGTMAAAHWGRCLPDGEGITYWPIAEMIRDAAGIGQDDPPETSASKLDVFLASLGSSDLDELRTIAAALANLLGAPVTPRGTYRAARISRAELHWGIRRLFELSAARVPAVLIVEDAHWAEPTLLELLGELLGARAPLLVLCSARPGLAGTAPDFVRPATTRRLLELGPLSDDEARELLAGLQPGPSAEAILAGAAGNPLFIQEAARLPAGYAVPSTVHALLAARLDLAPGPERATAGAAAVVGPVFWRRALEAIGEGSDVDAALAGLEERDVVRIQDRSTMAGDDEYAFTYPLFREVAYERVPEGERSLRHARCASWIEARTAGEAIDLIALHRERACLIARDLGAVCPGEPPLAEAVDVLRRAGERAERRGGMREAARYFARALELAGEAFPVDALWLRMRRAVASAALGGTQEAAEQLLDTIAAAHDRGLDELRCEASLALAGIERSLGRVDDARLHLTEAGALAAALDDEPMQARAALELGALAAQAGTVDEAAAALERAVALAESAGSRDLTSRALLRLGRCLLRAVRLADAEPPLVRGRDLAGEEGSLREQAAATALLAVIRFYRGPREDAHGLAMQARAWLERTADARMQTHNLRMLGAIAAASGRLDEAERHLRDAFAAAGAAGRPSAHVARHLVEVLVLGGKLREARDVAIDARRSLPDGSGDASARAVVLLAESFVATASGHHEESGGLFAEAEPLLGELGLACDLGEAHLSRGRLLLATDPGADAAEHLGRAREIFEAMGATAMLEDVEAARHVLVAS